MQRPPIGIYCTQTILDIRYSILYLSTYFSVKKKKNYVCTFFLISFKLYFIVVEEKFLLALPLIYSVLSPPKQMFFLLKD